MSDLILPFELTDTNLIWFDPINGDSNNDGSSPANAVSSIAGANTIALAGGPTTTNRYTITTTVTNVAPETFATLSSWVNLYCPFSVVNVKLTINDNCVVIAKELRAENSFTVQKISGTGSALIRCETLNAQVSAGTVFLSSGELGINTQIIQTDDLACLLQSGGVLKVKANSIRTFDESGGVEGNGTLLSISNGEAHLDINEWNGNLLDGTPSPMILQTGGDVTIRNNMETCANYINMTTGLCNIVSCTQAPPAATFVHSTGFKYVSPIELSAHMRRTANTNDTVISVIGTFVKINFASTIAAGLTGFTHTSPNRLDYIGPYDTEYDITASLTMGDLGGAINFRIGLAINGTMWNASRIAGRKAGATADKRNIVFNTLLRLNVGDYIEVWAANDTSTANIRFTDVQLKAVEAKI